MATLQAVKKAVTLPPTVRTLASGVPSAPLVNLAAKNALDNHHNHGAVAPRGDKQPAWAHTVSSSAAGMFSKSYMTGE
jgi:ubiquinol-cytochrome c reductase iron-sulfur subunit